MNKTVLANCANAHDSLAIVLRVQFDASDPTPPSGKSERVSNFVVLYKFARQLLARVLIS